MSAASAPLRGLRRRVAGIAAVDRFAIALRPPTATARAGATRHAHRRWHPSHLLSPRRSHSRTPFSPTTFDRVGRCDRFAAPSNCALSIALAASYTTPRKPRDGSGAATPAALRTLPLRRRSAKPLKYQWLSLPVAWATRKHIDDAGGRDYLTPNAAGCPGRHDLPSTTLDRPLTYRRVRPGTRESRACRAGKCSVNLTVPFSQIACTAKVLISRIKTTSPRSLASPRMLTDLRVHSN